ncbi:MAG: cytosine permease [Planctomycetes bacterium]|nr:cytosine permease [Planctomycetota bacterium]
MANEQLPAYLASAKPNPLTNRAPWYKTTAQTYAGIFLWIAFYDQLAGTANGPGTLGMSGLGTCLLALLVAGLVSHAFFYLVPGMLGLKSGLPLYIVGTSTFGTKGGYFLPGIFMGLLQIGWYSVATFFATKLMLGALGLGQHDYTLFGPPGAHGNGFSVVFVVMAVVWGYLFAFLGGLGIGVVARISTYFPIVPIAMLIISAGIAARHVGDYDRLATTKNSVAAASLLQEAQDNAENAAKAAGQTDAEVKNAGGAARSEWATKAASPEAIAAAPIDQQSDSMVSGAMKLAGLLLMVQLVVGFFATAGACGADFCSNNRNAKDVQMGGLVGIAIATLFAGGLAVTTVAGAHAALTAKVASGSATWGQLVAYNYSDAIGVIAPTWLSKSMLLLFAVGSIAPACFCSFIIGNSLSTMLARPQARVAITMAGATIGIVLAALGFAGNLAPFFGLIGASFGPVIGAMTADYLLSGRRWAGPREGVSIAGYGAWLVGFVVGILNHPWVGVLPGWHAASVYSFVVGFVVFYVLAAAGLRGRQVPYQAAPAQ